MKQVQASGGMNWRRFIAMLCIALLAFVMLEETSPAHAATDNGQAGIAYLMADAADAAFDPASGDEETPASPVQPQHHCCAAHCNGMTPALASIVITAQAMVRADPPRETEAAFSSATDALERPPKNAVIV